MKTHPFEKKISKLFNQHLKPIVSKANFQDSRYFQTAMFQMQDEMGRKAKAVETHQVEDFLLDLLRSLKQIEIEELLRTCLKIYFADGTILERMMEQFIRSSQVSELSTVFS